jgi:ABC-type branched-subunit amino acid transport system ATPase component/ABC-type branched-subunit amino acid transport system permease subunit
VSDTARRTLNVTLVLTFLLILPLIPGVPYDLINTGVVAAENLIVVLSIVLLIGLVGQISLAQAALVGMGAFVAAQFANTFGVRFPFELVVGLVAGAGTAAVIGIVALRVRGLYLAVATLIFGYVCDQYLFTQPWLVQNQSGTGIAAEAIGNPGTIPYFNLADAHVFYYVAFACAAFALYGVANIRDSRIGRAFSALRGSEVAAASLGIDVVRFKLIGFACAGALAGFGGALTLAGARTVVPDQFNFINSLDFLAIAVVGGLRSIGGAIASSLLFALLVGEVFYRSPVLADYLDLISAGLLVVVLLFFRGGLGAVPERVRTLMRHVQPRVDGFLDRLFPPRPVAALATAGGGSVPAADSREGDGDRVDVIALAGRLEARSHEADTAGEIHSVSHDAATPAERRRALSDATQVAGTPAIDGRREPVLLEAQDITVRFGGLTAVRDVSMRVCAGEIVGLIGPNGAGKTTLFNSILGLNEPSAGHVSLYGTDVTDWPVHRRAALGVGRTFQVLQLFGDLTVFDNLLVATHLQDKTGLWGSIWVTFRAREHDRECRERVQAVLKLVELEHLADRRVGDLPFGVLRLIEVARTLVTGAQLVCFDEPASGLDSSETEELIEWFRFLRQIGITLLVIEHDVSMVVRLCDQIYVLDQGSLIAHGTPAEIQRDPAVVASYLGTAAVA